MDRSLLAPIQDITFGISATQGDAAPHVIISGMPSLGRDGRTVWEDGVKYWVYVRHAVDISQGWELLYTPWSASSQSFARSDVLFSSNNDNPVDWPDTTFKWISASLGRDFFQTVAHMNWNKPVYQPCLFSWGGQSNIGQFNWMTGGGSWPTDIPRVDGDWSHPPIIGGGTYDRANLTMRTVDHDEICDSNADPFPGGMVGYARSHQELGQRGHIGMAAAEMYKLVTGRTVYTCGNSFGGATFDGGGGYRYDPDGNNSAKIFSEEVANAIAWIQANDPNGADLQYVDYYLFVHGAANAQITSEAEYMSWLLDYFEDAQLADHWGWAHPEHTKFVVSARSDEVYKFGEAESLWQPQRLLKEMTSDNVKVVFGRPSYETRDIVHLTGESALDFGYDIGAALFTTSGSEDHQGGVVQFAPDSASSTDVIQWWYDGTNVGDPASLSPESYKHNTAEDALYLSNLGFAPGLNIQTDVGPFGIGRIGRQGCTAEVITMYYSDTRYKEYTIAGPSVDMGDYWKVPVSAINEVGTVPQGSGNYNNFRHDGLLWDGTTGTAYSNSPFRSKAFASDSIAGPGFGQTAIQRRAWNRPIMGENLKGRMYVEEHAWAVASDSVVADNVTSANIMHFSVEPDSRYDAYFDIVADGPDGDDRLLATIEVTAHHTNTPDSAVHRNVVTYKHRSGSLAASTVEFWTNSLFGNFVRITNLTGNEVVTAYAEVRVKMRPL